MDESTITSKGQTTVPLKIRESIGAKPGTKLCWYVMPDGSLRVRVKAKSLMSLAGSLVPPEGVHVSIEDMNPFR